MIPRPYRWRLFPSALRGQLRSTSSESGRLRGLASRVFPAFFVADAPGESNLASKGAEARIAESPTNLPSERARDDADSTLGSRKEDQSVSNSGAYTPGNPQNSPSRAGGPKAQVTGGWEGHRQHGKHGLSGAKSWRTPMQKAASYGRDDLPGPEGFGHASGTNPLGRKRRPLASNIAPGKGPTDAKKFKNLNERLPADLERELQAIDHTMLQYKGSFAFV